MPTEVDIQSISFPSRTMATSSEMHPYAFLNALPPFAATSSLPTTSPGPATSLVPSCRRRLRARNLPVVSSSSSHLSSFTPSTPRLPSSSQCAPLSSAPLHRRLCGRVPETAPPSMSSAYADVVTAGGDGVGGGRKGNFDLDRSVIATGADVGDVGVRAADGDVIDDGVGVVVSDRLWRKQNATLVSQAQRHGVDAAVKLLWKFSQDGTAVTQNFNQVVSLLASNNRLEDGLALANEAGRRSMANIITFRPLMKWCCSHGDGRAAKRVWKAITHWRLAGDMFIYAELMGALVRSQDMESARRILDSLQESGKQPHIVLYNTLLKGYARQADVEQGFAVLQRLEEAGIAPDETTFNTLLNTCVRAMDADSSQTTMQLMERHGIQPGVPTFNTILKLYSREGPFEKALAILEEMKRTVEPSIVTYNTLIDGCAHRGDMARAGEFFEEMIDRGMHPDICTMTSLLKGFGRSHEPDRAIELFEGMKKGGFRIEERTWYAVISSCLRCRRRDEARGYLRDMKEGGLTVRTKTWMWMLECDVSENDEEGALEALSLMYANGSALDIGTKAMLIRESRERGGENFFVRLQRELKAARTVERTTER